AEQRRIVGLDLGVLPPRHVDLLHAVRPFSQQFSKPRRGLYRIRVEASGHTRGEATSPEDTAPSSYVVAQRDVAAAPLPLVGAKAATLARIAEGGVAVPPFHVLSSGAFALHLAANDICWPTAAEALADPARAAALRDSIREAPVPEVLARQVVEAYEGLCSASGHDQVAVRSSAGEEDSASASFAGQFSSILGVAGAVRLLDAVKECWASYLSARSLGYRAGRSMPLGDIPSFGVVVQVQVRAGKAGVAATVHPLEPDGDLLYIEANFGTGESVTGGLASPDAV